MKRIMCPVDFSDNANNAVEYAANLSKDLMAELTLYHVLDESSRQHIANASSGFGLKGRKELDVLERLETYCQTVKESFSIHCRPKVETSTPKMEAALKKETQTGKYDLVIMGTGGKSEINQFFLGTHTNPIIGKVSVPVLVVPGDSVYRKIQNVVYASNYKLEDMASLSLLMSLAQAFDPCITVLHVNRKRTEKDEEIRQLLQDVYRDKLKKKEITFNQIASDNVAVAIDNYVEQNTADLLVLVTHTYSWIQEIFHDSVTKKISLLANYPVLILNFSDEIN